MRLGIITALILRLVFILLILSFVSTSEAKGPVRIFDGKTLKGWEHVRSNVVPKNYHGGKWEVVDGAIVGSQNNDGRGSILLSKNEYKNFELTMDIKPDWGCDSGVWIWVNSKGQALQVFIDYLQDGNIGFVYGQNSGGWATMPWRFKAIKKGKNVVGVEAVDKYDAVQIDGLLYSAKAEVFNKVWKFGEFNSYKIRIEGKHPVITTWINGEKMMVWDAKSYKGRDYKNMLRQKWGTPSKFNKEDFYALNKGKGKIALQVHPGKARWNGFMRFKNIVLEDL